MKHELMSPADCREKHGGTCTNEGHCPVCDGSLAVCRNCGGAESDLENDCTGKREPKQERSRLINILYTNHAGEIAWRLIEPERIWFGSTQWHPQPQWLMDAIDKSGPGDYRRTFAIKDIHALRS